MNIIVVATQVPATPLPSRYERPQTIATQPADTKEAPPQLVPSTLEQKKLVGPARKGFEIHYDKLVIAVGAYSQSNHINLDASNGMQLTNPKSLQYSRSKGACLFPQRRSRCSSHPFSDS